MRDVLHETLSPARERLLRRRLDPAGSDLITAIPRDANVTAIRRRS
jgi:hypothetical protein